MRLCVAFAFICVMLPAVYGLKCYTCWGMHPGTCDRVWDCAHGYDHCSSTIVAQNLITKGCMRSDMCNVVTNVGVRCCSEDLCNGAKPSALFVPLLLAPFAIITLFI